MSISSSFTLSDTFTRTHARKLASKVASDMHQCNRLYGRGPSDAEIQAYMDELVAMLSGAYLLAYEFGFQTGSERRVVSWQYQVTASGQLEGGRSGGLYATADLNGTSMFNVLTPSTEWRILSPGDKAKVNAEHAVTRTIGDGPVDGTGYWATSREYAAGGVSITRREFRPW